MRLFKKGLQKAPQDSGLHFNAAITLMGEKKLEEAIAHFVSAIDGRPGYSSPYFYLGRLPFGKNLRRVERLFYSLRLVMLDPNSERSGLASETIVEMLNLGVERESADEVRIQVAVSGDEGPTDSLALMLSIAAVSDLVEELADATDARKAVHALSSFVQMTRELGGNGGDLSKTAVWRQAMVPVLELNGGEENLETLLFWVAARAGLDGGGLWLEEHDERVQRLGEALSE